MAAMRGDVVLCDSVGALRRFWQDLAGRLDFEPRIADVAQPLLRVFDETSRQDAPKGRRRVGGKRRPVGFPLENPHDGVRHRVAGERRAPVSIS